MFLLFLLFILSLSLLLLSIYKQSSMTQATGLTTTSDFLQCPQCPQPRFFKGKHGLNIHISKSHNKNKTFSQDSTSSCISNSTLLSSSSTTPFWLILANLKSSVPVVKRIPKGARIAVAKNLSAKIKKVLTNPSSAQPWESLLTFAFQILHADKNNNQSLTSSIKHNCIRTNTSQQNDQQTSAPQSFHKQHSLIHRIESKVSDGDLKGASKLLFSNDIIAPNTPETLAALMDKHPLSPTPVTPSPPSPSVQPIEATDDDVYRAVMSFRSGSASGHDGLSPQHLKDLLGTPGDAGRALLVDVTALVNLMISGKVHKDTINLLYGANLCALKKKDGGIRPIAVGCTFRRITSKVCCKQILPKLTNKFQPTQLGFGSKGGCEAAVHALRTYLQNDGGQVVVKVDVKNAFNSVSRSAMLSEIQNYTPEIYEYLLQCYGSESTLIYKNHSILSSSGCQQGDPLGPAIFGLAIHPIISSLTSKLNMWYLDDGTLGGDSETVLDDLKLLIEKFSAIGLELNFSKCELFIVDSVVPSDRNVIIEKFNSVAPNIKILDKQSLCLLGAPIFTDAFPSFITEQKSKFEESSDRLSEIHSHMAFYIIRFCLLVPKLTYVLRCCPFWMFSDLLSTLDNSLKSSLVKILNCPMTEISWSQASLPIRFGGLGIRKISSISLPAFLSSVYSTRTLFLKIIESSLGNVQTNSMLEATNAWTITCPDESLPNKPSLQRLWDEPINKKIHLKLLSDATSPVDRARLLASAERESGFWLQALPSTNIGTLLDNNTFSLSVSLRIGANTNEPHHCQCGVSVDRQGHHGLSCRRSAGRQSRHASLNDVIRRALATVNVPAILEPNGIARDDGKRPDGMTLIPWSRGKPLVWDATCVDTLAASHVPSTSKVAGSAATTAEGLKRRKYECLGDGYIFLPFGVETLGPWGQTAWLLYKELSKRLTERTSDQKAGAYLGQRISIAIQRGNVASLLGTLPVDGDLSSVFYL